MGLKRIVAHMNKSKGESCNSSKCPISIGAYIKYVRSKFHLTNQSKYLSIVFNYGVVYYVLGSYIYVSFHVKHLTWCHDCINIYFIISRKTKKEWIIMKPGTFIWTHYLQVFPMLDIEKYLLAYTSFIKSDCSLFTMYLKCNQFSIFFMMCERK